MLCQNCQKRIANIHFTQVINNSKVEMFLCDQCAREKGQFNFGTPISINDFFSGLIGQNNTASHITSSPQQLVCEKCGMSFDEFQKGGRLGCNKCYDVFGERLKPVIKRLHGDVEHKGKVPDKALKDIKVVKEIDKLKEELNKAIKSEEYEKAAGIRDRIKRLETSESKG